MFLAAIVMLAGPQTLSRRQVNPASGTGDHFLHRPRLVAFRSTTTAAHAAKEQIGAKSQKGKQQQLGHDSPAERHRCAIVSKKRESLGSPFIASA